MKNKEIKFRIWDTQEKKFYQPAHEAYNGKLDILFIALNGDLIRQTMTGLVHESLFPDRYIKQQFTGLQDRNGKDIYEGDIVKGELRRVFLMPNCPNPQICKVEYDEQMLLNPFHMLVGYDGELWTDALVDGFEIIGNIYEHPHLLPDA